MQLPNSGCPNPGLPFVRASHSQNTRHQCLHQLLFGNTHVSAGLERGANGERNICDAARSRAGVHANGDVTLVDLQYASHPIMESKEQAALSGVLTKYVVSSIDDET